MDRPDTKTADEPVPAPAAETTETTDPGRAPAPDKNQKPETLRPLEGASSRWVDLPVRIVATVLTAASAVFTTVSVWDLLAGPGADVLWHVVGVTAGLGVEAGWLLILAAAYGQAARTGRVATWLTAMGWALALATAAILLVHGLGTGHWGMALLAALPVMAKAGWHVLTHTRGLATVRVLAERDADDTGLTLDQRTKVAAARQNAAFKRELADAQAEEAEADIYASNRVDMAKDKAEAERLRQRYELAGEIAGRLPLEVLAQLMPGLVPEMPATTQVREVPTLHRALDRSETTPAGTEAAPAAAAPAGFGAALMEAATATGGTILRQGGGTAADLGGHTPDAPRGGGNGGIGSDQGRQAPAAPHHAARVAAGQSTRQRVLEAVEAHGAQVSNAELSRLLRIGRTTVREHRNALAADGHPVYPPTK